MRSASDTTRPRARSRMGMVVVTASLWARGWSTKPRVDPLPRRCLQLIVPSGAPRSMSLARRIAHAHRERGSPAIVRQVTWRGKTPPQTLPKAPIRAGGRPDTRSAGLVGERCSGEP